MITITHAVIPLCLLLITLLVFIWIRLEKLYQELLDISLQLTIVARGFPLTPDQSAQLWQWNETLGRLEKTPKPTRSTHKLISKLKG